MANYHWKFCILPISCLLLVSFRPATSSNILFFHLAGTASHKTSVWPLAERLAEAGHNVTYIFPVKTRNGHHPKVEEIIPSKMTEVETLIAQFDINYRFNNSINDWLVKGISKCPEFCADFYDSPETKEWLQRPGLHYDLVIIDSSLGQCVYGLVHKFGAKHIMFDPVNNLLVWEALGIITQSSSIPEFLFHPKPTEMTLWNRMLTTVAPLIWRMMCLNYMWTIEPMVREKLNLTDMPSFEEIERNTSLVFTSSFFIEDYPVALPPMFVSYSGLWCSKRYLEKKSPLPEELASYLDDDDMDGFVYISFGSAVVVSKMPEEFVNQFFSAFEAFQNLKFLWRWTGEVPKNLPGNVLLQSWFPQTDVLAHPKIKAFVTQGGRPSIQEALCYGVPMITIPIFADQDFNAHRMEYIGAGIILDIGALTSKKLQDGIREIVENNKYKIRLTELSAMYRDRPIDPVESAHYWVEYVLRHNTSLMKPLGMQQTWWQRRLVDVYALIAVFILGITATLLAAGYLAWKWTSRLIRYTRTIVGKEKKD